MSSKIRVFENGPNGPQFEYKAFTFNGGEEQIVLDLKSKETSITRPRDFIIDAHLETSQDIIRLLIITDALKQYGTNKISLVCPYFPYARQDRVMQSGEALSVRVMANLINAQGYSKVIIWDAHSDVAPALIDRVRNISQHELARKFIKDNFFDNDYCVLVAPDAGAIKKVMKLSELCGISMVRADKHRDVRTGQITETVVYSEHVGNKNFVIVDDICDGGRTFIELAQKLRPLTSGKIYLYVTHGIFANGLNVFEGIIDGIFCPNPFSGFNRAGYSGEFKTGL